MLSKIFIRRELNMENMTLRELEDLESEVRYITEPEFQTLKWNKLYHVSICDGSAWIDEIEDDSQCIRIFLKGSKAPLYFHVVEDCTEEWDRQIEKRTPDAFGMWAVIESRNADEWVTLVSCRQEALNIARAERDHLTREERKSTNLTVAYVAAYRDEEDNMIRAFPEDKNGNIDSDYCESIEIEL